MALKTSVRLDQPATSATIRAALRAYYRAHPEAAQAIPRAGRQAQQSKPGPDAGGKTPGDKRQLSVKSKASKKAKLSRTGGVRVV